MNLNFSGFLFVLIVILEAISGLALNKTSVPKIHTQDLPEAQPVSDKSQTENGITTESVKIIIPNTSEVIPKLKFNEKNTTTNSTGVTAATIPSPDTMTDRTPSPPTTPTPTPTPTPPPPPPPPEKGFWVVRNETSKITCIIAEMAMQLSIIYPGTNSLKNAVVNVPKNASANGTCSKTLQTLNISWGPGHSLQINFSANESANNFFISELSLNVNATVFQNVPEKETFWHFKNSSSEFMTPLDMSYKCSRAQDISLVSDKDNLTAVLTLINTQLEAYMNKTKGEFGAAQDCDSFDTPDIVPIAVGCALAILVLVVLVAYLIGRKRSQNRGYLSM